MADHKLITIYVFQSDSWQQHTTMLEDLHINQLGKLILLR